MLAHAQPSVMHERSGAQQRAFNPYSENGGTILAVSSRDFAVVASDTRQSEGYSIQSRYQPRVFALTDETVMATQGFMADSNTLVKKLRQRLEWYFHTHQKYPDLTAIARLVQTMLYGKRFFPYYSYVILGGIDRDGTGAVYSFDPVGSYERESCRSAGAAQSLVQPFLDNQVMGKNQNLPKGESILDEEGRSNLPLERVLGLVVDSFTGATERHIEVGDGLEMYVLKVVSREGGKNKVELDIVRRDLKRD
ncbi:uncharacterized protein L969DRAFT_86458 [Mixia osmundae IAM 14324]|uniref:Proteasome subunit beta n=1 Tax=Mixia osmundae (strain CBS 9802 / IAM 14324 / JCM 22182 / KY 12970) TaxID=764103 RepID=G7E9B6_MIXOS|nr:uncharacterized protein L969DRAFT_86458 [Mixia osmundae IAM 14324]KEI39862.1 hypothetical protein L969DRAFT_86458 [Mixia osmundae IAM 14324]GAA99235.1 hypothetical protein E5Q_05929 [Mixia osmundae IAM 14324]